MNKLAENLNAKVVESITILEDNILIMFTEGSKLNLFNPVSKFDQETITGQLVDKIILGKDSLRLIFNKGEEIQMSLRDEDYQGPEALVFRGSNGKIITF